MIIFNINFKMSVLPKYKEQISEIVNVCLKSFAADKILMNALSENLMLLLEKKMSNIFNK